MMQYLCKSSLLSLLRIFSFFYPLKELRPSLYHLMFGQSREQFEKLELPKKQAVWKKIYFNIEINVKILKQSKSVSW